MYDLTFFPKIMATLHLKAKISQIALRHISVLLAAQRLETTELDGLITV